MRPLKIFQLLTVLLSAAGSCFGQQAVTGTLTLAASGDPVEEATVTACPTGSTLMISYCTSDMDGNFRLSCDAFPDTIRLTVRSIMTSDTTVVISSSTEHIVLRLEDAVKSLREVKIMAPKIREIGDTINYYVTSYADSLDRSIGDVIKKMPGIQVLPSGKILYQGKEINKFYVEGKDLLQGRYGIATNNIPADKIATVQVLRNHQPIRVLKDTEIPDNAAINLKLKDSSIGAFFMTAQVGLGLPLWLLSNELTAMRFTRNQQNLAVYKGDNTGHDVASEMTAFYNGFSGNNIRFFDRSSMQSSFIPSRYSLFDDTHMGSANDLRTLGNDYTLTTSINYLHDRQRSENICEQEVYVVGSDVVHIAEETNSTATRNELNGKVTLEKNTETAYVSNSINVFSNWNDQQDCITHAGTVSQYFKLPSVGVEDNFRTLRKDERHTTNWEGNFKASTNDENLVVSAPASNDDSSMCLTAGQQQLSFQNVEMDAAYREYLRLADKWSTTYSVGAFLNYYRLNSELLPSGDLTASLQEASMSNDFQRREYGMKGLAEINYFGSRLSGCIGIPLHLMELDRNDRISGMNARKTYFIPTPNAYISYRLHNVSFRLDASYGKKLASFRNDLSGYLLSSYRRLSRNEGTLRETSTLNASLLVSYENPFSSLFASAQLDYSHLSRNTLNNVVYQGVVSQMNEIKYSNQGQTGRLELTAGRSFDLLSTTVKATADLNYNDSWVMYYGAPAECRQLQAMFVPSFTSSIAHVVLLRYDGMLSYGTQAVESTRLRPVMQSRQRMELAVLPVKTLTMKVSVTQCSNSLLQSKRSFWFLDMELKLKRKKIEYVVDWTNVTGTNSFESMVYDHASSNYSCYRLRPSELLLNVRFKLK